jgi:hypothetical protein
MNLLMNILPVSLLLSLHMLYPSGNLINLAQPTEDIPQDNAFQMVGPQFTVGAVEQILNNELPAVFNQMHPSTEDPTIRNVTLDVNGNNIQFGFQKHIAFLWDQVNLVASTSVDQTNCTDPSQTGFEVILTMLGSTSKEAQGYANGVRILVCAQQTQTSDGPALNVTIERDLYAGPEYADWIGSLMGDFLRNFGPTLGSTLLQ